MRFEKQKLWEELDKEFYSFFQEHVWVFADLFVMRFEKLAFDVFKFGIFMKYQGYEPSGDVSLAQFVEKKYGVRACEIIRILLKIE